MSPLLGWLIAGLALLDTVAAGVRQEGAGKVKPKVFIIDMVRWP
jgi:hypothetical protein